MCSATLAGAGPAPAAPVWTSTTYRCSGTSAGGQAWKVIQANTNCAFARYAIRTAIERRRSPKNWRCRVALNREFSPEGVPYRVRCTRGEKRVLGLAR